MNIAFPALFIFLLVLPGIVCRYHYRKGAWESPVQLKSPADEIAFSILTAILLHGIWCAIIYPVGYFVGFRVDFQTVFVLATAQKGPALEKAIAQAASLPFHIFFYFVLLHFLSIGLGYGVHKLVRSRKLDHKHKFFRFDNPWYYLLKGEVLEFAENDNGMVNYDDTYISAVIDHGGNEFIYLGQLTEFYFDKEGNLDRLVLRDVQRRKLNDDLNQDHCDVDGLGTELSDEGNAKQDTHFYFIEGDYFVLSYKDIKTLNIVYSQNELEEIDVEDQEEEPHDDEAPVISEV